MRTRVYVDGYNLYYSCLKHSPYKWLNISDLVTRKFPKNAIEYVRYFTARVKPRPHDPGQAQRQEAYFRALRTDPKIEIHLGHFLTHPVTMPEAKAWNRGEYKKVQVVKTEEKGSDVNLATYLLMDAFDNLFDAAIVVSNDSDLAEPIRLVRERFNKPVGLFLHRSVKISGKLRPLASFIKQFTNANLERAQFDEQLSDKAGRIHKPKRWKAQ